MLALNETVTLWVIGGRLATLNAEEGGQLRPEGARELATAVRHDRGGNAKAGNPMMQQGISASLGGD